VPVDDGGLPPTGVGQDVRRYLDLRQEEERERVAGLVAEAAATLRARLPRLAVEEVVRLGEPAAEILEQTSEWSADLIVAGARGRSVLQGLLLGSVSEALVVEAPCPVLIGRETSGPLDRVLVAVGQQDDAAKMTEACLALPLAAGAQIIVVTVYAAVSGGPAEATPGRVPGAESAAHAVAELLRRRAPDWAVEERTLAGDIASALLAEAVAQAADLIVVGARQRQGLTGRLGLGSVSRKLVRRAGSAVLVVRGRRGDGQQSPAAADSGHP
jgi:nucleotide-binding universal stress UspA family protein